jgi:ABC-type transport system involved in cytochrome bd biosynthesis fused ATPase/permease subunit
MKTTALYTIFQKASAVLMILALVWLTVSLPVVSDSMKELAGQEMTNSPLTPEEETSNPLNGTTEEKAPTSSSTVSEEYLHEHHKTDPFFLSAAQIHMLENAGTYTAFHGELLVPPPNQA